MVWLRVFSFFVCVYNENQVVQCSAPISFWKLLSTQKLERQRIIPLPLFPQHSHESKGSATVFTFRRQPGKMESTPLLLRFLLASVLSRFGGFLWHLSRGHNCPSPTKEKSTCQSRPSHQFPPPCTYQYPETYHRSSPRSEISPI